MDKENEMKMRELRVKLKLYVYYATPFLYFLDKSAPPPSSPLPQISTLRACIVQRILHLKGLLVQNIKEIELLLFLVEVPGNSLPFLSVDGVVVSQSMTINRHLARVFGEFV